jgi:L-threonylcarbamoyladenylate synthase
VSGEIKTAAAAIRAGKLVAMPTETVYGLAADAFNVDAVLSVFSAKGRPTFDPLIVHVADAQQAWMVAVPSARAKKLAEKFWPGPLTLVLPKRDIVPDAVTSGLDTVAVRCPDHPLALELLRACGRPIAAPSANRFGRISPTTAAHVREQFGDEVFIIDGGPCRIGIESTVLLCDPKPIILRPGGTTKEALEAALGEKMETIDPKTYARQLSPEAPGMLAKHYSPRKPIRLKESKQAWPDDPNLGYLSWTGAGLPKSARWTEILSKQGDFREGAVNLFAGMRRLDASGATSLIAELVPERDLGTGINDRLRRAAGIFG